MPLHSKPTKVVNRARVYVIGVQRVVTPDLWDFLDDEGFPGWSSDVDDPGEVIPEVAGRLCYMSFAGGRDHADYVAHLRREGHGSVFEHAVITFILTGVSRSFTHQCIRHRAGWSYSQLSQRYVDESFAQMVLPPLLTALPDGEQKDRVRGTWEDACNAAHRAYLQLKSELERVVCPPPGDTSSRKQVREAARSVLPAAVETKICCTVNARAFRHFLEMRASPGADREIRAVALQLYRAVQPFWPDLLADYEVRHGEDGEPYLHTDTPKV